MTLGIKAKISKIGLDDRKYLRDTERAINKVIKEAAREFLITVLQAITGAPHTVGGGSFPVQTGEAAGSLKPIAAVLGRSQLGADFSITPAVDSRYKDGRLRPNKIAKGRSQGHVQLGRTGRNMIFVFNYSTDVFHFLINDLTGSDIPKSDTPWKTMALGFAAFEAYIDKHLFNRIPKIDDYLFSFGGDI